MASLVDAHIISDHKMKLLTLEDYQKAGETFWEKYWYVAKELGDDARTEDILKAMEAIGAVALKMKLDDKDGPFGFNKLREEDDRLGYDTYGK